MKVFELMAVLSKLPAGQEVKVNGSEATGEPFELYRVEESDDVMGTTIICFDDSTIKYESELKEEIAA